MAGARSDPSDSDPGAPRSHGRVAYVVRAFPMLSQTFILNELLALDALGLEARIYSLEVSRARREHVGADRLRERVHVLEPSSKATRRVARRRPFAWFSGWVGAWFRSVVRRDPLALPRFRQAVALAADCRRRDVRHLHAHFADDATAVAATAAHLAGISFSFTAHAFDVFRNDVDRARLVRHLRSARFIVTVSEFNVRFLRELAGRAIRVELVFNGIDLARFSPPATPPGPPFTIACVARLVAKKGVEVLIDACRILKERGIAFRCEHIGTGIERATFEKRAADAGLAGVFEFRGPQVQEQVIDLYRRAHVFALPCIVAADGDRDGLPVAIVEALACGVPVVSTAVTGIPEAVTDGVNGVIVAQNDALAVADAIERLAKDDAARARMAAEARRSVAEKFDRDRTIRRLFAILEEAVG